jgi:hypothetical protein
LEKGRKVHIVIFVAFLKALTTTQKHDSICTNNKIEETDESGFGSWRIRLYP